MTTSGLPATPIRSTEALGRAVRRARLAAGLTQEQLANLGTTSRQAIIAIEQGKETRAMTAVFDLLLSLGLELSLQERPTDGP